MWQFLVIILNNNVHSTLHNLEHSVFISLNELICINLLIEAIKYTNYVGVALTN